MIEHIREQVKRAGPAPTEKPSKGAPPSGMPRAVVEGMQASSIYRTCPHCASDRLIFLEHGSGVIVFQCEACSRATVQRWTPATVGTAPPGDPFQFPAWFSGVAEPAKMTTF
jgi:hypothetical protein